VRQDSLHDVVARDERDGLKTSFAPGQWAGSISSVRRISSAHGMYDVQDRHGRVLGAGACAEAGPASGAPEHTGGGVVLASGALQDTGNVVVSVGFGFVGAGGLTC
jgi:hypothetical protein